MAMVSVNKLADDMGMSVNDVRRIARNSGFSRYKDAKVELYNSNDFESFGSEKMKKRKLSKEHKAKLAGKKK
tara:strand:- start:1457 stop:1672 length:216 start_codon:yes stop_codon:yes gene_type:complete